VRTQRRRGSAASAVELGRRPSGSRSGSSATVGGNACSRRGSIVIAASALRHRHLRGDFTWRHGSFGPRACLVLDDVGVRFGGSEHHRIETSFWHTRPRPARPGSRPRGTADGALRSTARTTPQDLGDRASSEVTAPSLLRPEPTTSPALAPGPPGYGNRRSSEHRAHGLTGYGNRRSSEHRAHGLTGVGRRRSSERCAPRHRDRDTGPLRRPRPPFPSDLGHRTSSEATDPWPTGPEPPRHGTGQTALLGAPRARLVGMLSRLPDRDPALLGARTPPSNRTGNPDLLGGPGAPASVEVRTIPRGSRRPPFGVGSRKPAGRTPGVRLPLRRAAFGTQSGLGRPTALDRTVTAGRQRPQ